MSSSVFPVLVGLAFDVGRTPVWSNIVQQSVSGKETRIGLWSAPRWQYELTYDVLRGDATYAEFQNLAGFFNARKGRFDSFLYTDPDDSAVTGQGIATGDGIKTAFQMIRSFGGFVEPVLAFNATVTPRIYLNGVLQSGANYSISAWGSATPGVITFTTAPGSGVAITADFSFYWPVRFDDDSMSFNKFMAALWEAKSVKFTSLK